MHENEISYQIRSAIFKVYNSLGPGLLESAYEAVLAHILTKQGLETKTQVGLPLIFEDVQVNVGYRMDIVVAGKVVIEVKSVDELTPVHHKQLLTYLKLSGMKLGILVNFNTDEIAGAIFRKVYGLGT